MTHAEFSEASTSANAMSRADFAKAAALCAAEVNRCGLDTAAGREAQQLMSKLSYIGNRLKDGMRMVPSGTPAWPPHVLARVKIPIPLRAMVELTKAITLIAKQKGKQSRMQQEGDLLEFFVEETKAVAQSGQGELRGDEE